MDEENTIEVIVEPGVGEGARLDRFLADTLTDFSRSRLQSLIKDGFIDVNAQPAKPRHSLAVGDTIRITIPEPEPLEALPEDIPISVLHEDEDIVVIDKAAGMVVHPGAGNPSGTLVNALLHHCGEQLSGIGGVSRPGIVHRLDKDTSGCIVVAKNDIAHQALSAQFSNRTTHKQYLAVVAGIPAKESGTMTTNIARHPVNRLRMTVVDPPRGREAITGYEILTKHEKTGTALLLCTIHTGRTHQIRVHCRHLGHPILGDSIYAKPQNQPGSPRRLMLHAWKLEFDHPTTSARLSFEAAVPPEYERWNP